MSQLKVFRIYINLINHFLILIFYELINNILKIFIAGIIHILNSNRVHSGFNAEKLLKQLKSEMITHDFIIALANSSKLSYIKELKLQITDKVTDESLSHLFQNNPKLS